MRKTIMVAAAIAACGAALPAAAQSTVTGTVVINGNVPGKCQVLTGGNGISQTFGATVDLQDLSAADGTLRTGIVVDSSGFSDLEARVVCTTAQADVSLTASPLAINGAAAPEAGYANSIDYSATAVLTTTTGTTPVNVLTSAGAPQTDTIGRLANNGGNNIVISADGFSTAPGAILEQGSYTGTIVLSISPAP